ncbi:hypothetical protein GCK32_015569 [Trichostrongylus colubriformis]|uniref:Uncharacterized protein n=1 Tax=Trichostrongylus colubriformis TaxID=6319 RepID=A0AAN8FJN9_TRICO
MKKCCVLCNRTNSVETMKQMSPAEKLNLITAASLSLIGVVDRADVDNVVEKISQRNRFLCHSHVVQAAQYLTAEMAVTGRGYSHYDDPSSLGSTAYVNTSDVPPHLVEVINGMSTRNIIVTVRDVASFINSALKRYHGTSLWTQYHEEGIEEDQLARPYRQPREGDSAACSQLVTGAFSASGKLFKGGEECGENGGAVSIRSVKAPEFAPNGSCSESSSASLSDYIGETDAADLEKYFIVQGGMLMKLFRFCPECGHRLGKSQLKPDGTTALVKFVCENCRIRPSRVKRWKSRDRVVACSKEQSFKGNALASASAITTGLRYRKLARWAKQINLSMFSKSFF